MLCLLGQRGGWEGHQCERTPTRSEASRLKDGDRLQFRYRDVGSWEPRRRNVPCYKPLLVLLPVVALTMCCAGVQSVGNGTS
eukprot:1172115-Rhodomonas_salina.1